MSELLAILKITKQSLSRVINLLVDQDYIEQQQGTLDRRQRLLRLTEKGRLLEHALTENQRRRFARAYRHAGADAVEGFRQVLLGLIEEPPDEYSIQGERRTARL